MSIDWLVGLPSRTPGDLTPNEESLLSAYREIENESIQRLALNAALDAPKK